VGVKRAAAASRPANERTNPSTFALVDGFQSLYAVAGNVRSLLNSEKIPSHFHFYCSSCPRAEVSIKYQVPQDWLR
jgi:hypothetical protein